MREVGAIVLVDGEAETTLEGSDMILEEIGILIKVDCFECKLSQSFTPICICAGV